MNNEKYDVLLVEDDPADVFLAEEIFGEHPDIHLHVVNDGKDALAFVRHEGNYADAPPPHIILLDLNIPGLDGRGVLKALKNDPELCVLPVIIMSTSDAPEDVQSAYAHGANCFITKPVGIDGFEDLIKSLKDFWFRFAQLPVD